MVIKLKMLNSISRISVRLQLLVEFPSNSKDKKEMNANAQYTENDIKYSNNQYSGLRLY